MEAADKAQIPMPMWSEAQHFISSLCLYLSPYKGPRMQTIPQFFLTGWLVTWLAGDLADWLVD